MGYNYDVTSNVAPQIVNQVAIVSFYKPTNVVSWSRKLNTMAGSMRGLPRRVICIYIYYTCLMKSYRPIDAERDIYIYITLNSWRGRWRERYVYHYWTPCPSMLFTVRHVALPWKDDMSINQEFTLWLFNIAMENGPFVDDFPIKTSIYKGFSMAMLNNQRVFSSILSFRSIPNLRWSLCHL